jgi:hypothetical protein
MYYVEKDGNFLSLAEKLGLPPSTLAPIFVLLGTMALIHPLYLV